MPTEWKFSGKQDVYLEVANYYKSHILRGVLRAGDKLPSVRMAAGELSVNPNTVAKAYAHLESEGFIRALPKKGAFVTYVPEKKPESATPTEAAKNKSAPVTDTAARLCKNTIIALKESGIDRATLLKLIEEVYCND